MINWCRADSTATIDTAAPVVIRKLDKLVALHPDTYKVKRVDSNYYAKMYTAPAKYIHFGKPHSEAQREALQEARVLAQKSSANPSGSSCGWKLPTRYHASMVLVRLGFTTGLNGYPA